jgi:hypothetical protein
MFRPHWVILRQRTCGPLLFSYDYATDIMYLHVVWGEPLDPLCAQYWFALIVCAVAIV